MVYIVIYRYRSDVSVVGIFDDIDKALAARAEKRKEMPQGTFLLFRSEMNSSTTVVEI